MSKNEKKRIQLTEFEGISNFESIGKNIRKYRVARGLRQEGLAERCGLSPNYIGMLERGEKVPSLETFIRILNVLEVSSDFVLVDVLNTGYIVKQSIFEEKLEKLSLEERERIFDVLEALLKHTK